MSDYLRRPFSKDEQAILKAYFNTENIGFIPRKVIESLHMHLNTNATNPYTYTCRRRHPCSDLNPDHSIILAHREQEGPSVVASWNKPTNDTWSTIVSAVEGQQRNNVHHEVTGNWLFAAIFTGLIGILLAVFFGQKYDQSVGIENAMSPFQALVFIACMMLIPSILLFNTGRWFQLPIAYRNDKILSWIEKTRGSAQTIVDVK